MISPAESVKFPFPALSYVSIHIFDNTYVMCPCHKISDY